jgi:hypothetical protein
VVATDGSTLCPARTTGFEAKPTLDPSLRESVWKQGVRKYTLWPEPEPRRGR